MKTIKIECSDKKLAKEFMSYMDNQGEQDFWTWLECKDESYRCKIVYDHANFTITMTTE